MSQNKTRAPSSRKVKPTTIGSGVGLVPNVRTKKIVPYLERYQQHFLIHKRPIPRSFVEQIKKELCEWMEEERLTLRRFYLERGIPQQVWYDLLANHEDLKEMYELAQSLIGVQREELALAHKLNPGMVQYSMPFYDPSWKAMAEFHARLKNNTTGEDGPKVIVIEHHPDEKDP